MFRRAIVRIPGAKFAEGLTSVDYGVPQLSRALEQHAAYCAALESCGLALTRLGPDLAHPDSTFVEDTAVLAGNSAILTRPGASSREQEVAAIRPVIERFFADVHQIASPGTLDGGDVCEARSHFFIGVSRRTNEEGARQLGAILQSRGYTFSTVDVRATNSILHLKSGLACLEDKTLVVMEELADDFESSAYRLVRVPPEESYACNCVQVNDRVLLPSGYPQLMKKLQALGYRPLPLDVSEFRKMDGGLSCLSLRF